MKSILLDIYGASDRLLFSENDYRNPSNSKVISALQELMCDKNFCTLYSLFMLALARKELSTCSFRLFVGEKPNLLQAIEDLPTKATDEELKEAFVDECGVKYSKDGRKLLKAPYELNGTYSIRKGTKIICDEAFSGCRSLKSLVIPDGVTSIGDGAFFFCRFLSGIVIPNSVASIGDSAFEGCSSLEYISLPKSVICLNGNPFFYWNGKLECLSPNFIYEDDVLFNKDKSKIISFRNQAVKSYIIPNSVTSIGEWAFEGCSSLTDIVIPDSVTSIGESVFSGCSSLEYISLPKSVICLNGNPFFNWNGKLECLSPNFIYEDDVLFNKDKSKIISFRNQAVISYIIPDSVTSIGDRAFSGCSFLFGIVIPNSVTSIGDRTFCGCSFLTEVDIPDSVTSIGNGAFYDCNSLRSVVIPDSVTSIGERAFEDCNFPYKLNQELISRFGEKIFG